MTVVAAVFVVGMSIAITLLVSVYFVGWQEERRVKARIQRRLREISRDPGQSAGA